MIRLFPFFFAFRILFNKSKAGMFRHIRGAVIGAAISLVPLIVVSVIADGMIEGIVSRYIEVGSFHIQVRLPADTGAEEEADIMEQISSLENVETVFPCVQGGGILYAEDGRTGITVRGIPDSVYSENHGFRQYITVKDGDFSLAERDSIVISSETAEKLKVAPGDSIKLLTARVVPGRPVLLRPTSFRVTGIYTSGYQDLDMLSAFISLECGTSLFKEKNSRMLGVTVTDPFGDELYSVMDEIYSSVPGVRLSGWETLNDSLVASLDTTRKFLIFIMILILAVASVNISSSMIMMVISKKQDIAVLKSAGATDRDISSIFMITALFIGVCAAVLGTAVGVTAAVNINGIIAFLEGVCNISLFDSQFYLESIPVDIDPGKLAVFALLAVFFSVAASWLPARQGGRIKPVEIFRKH